MNLLDVISIPLALPYMGNCGTTLLKKLQTSQNRAARVTKGANNGEADHPKNLQINILNVHKLGMLDTVALAYKVLLNLCTRFEVFLLSHIPEKQIFVQI